MLQSLGLVCLFWVIFLFWSIDDCGGDKKKEEEERKKKQTTRKERVGEKRGRSRREKERGGIKILNYCTSQILICKVFSEKMFVN